MKIILFVLFLFGLNNPLTAQLKFVVEDFEGFADGASDLKANGVFTFGNITASVERNTSQLAYSGDRFLKISKVGNMDYGGWGKGISLNVVLDPHTDYLNFYVYQPAGNDTNTIKIELQEDDNGNSVYEKENDDSWNYLHIINNKNTWQLISIPLNKFKDSNKGGDGIFNINYKEGKLLTFNITFTGSDHLKKQNWSFDFICFSKGKLLTGNGLFDAPSASSNDFCNLGAWSKEGNSANFTDIATSFESYFKSSSDKKLGVIHFFQPFATDGGNTQNHYPSVERINKVIQQGYIPMITLEDHFVNSNPNIKQPNLYSIVEGHFDSFFVAWAKQIKKVDGVVLLRILHEFNGDWYPWCIANNDKNPQLLIKAYRHIHDIFKEQQVTNVKFIWCPNSTSFPQEKWNFIMDAYPGNGYVDFVGLDIYNGAGKASVWRSFRKEGIENYFILTQTLPDKPLFICETASRERESSEPHSAQNKAEWIKDMSKTLSSDMSKVKLLTWFNEKSTFKINTSQEAENAYSIFIWKNDYFKSGTKYMYPMLGR
jgi:beta-mannanase